MITLATISGNGSRPSIFGSSSDKTRGFHPTLGQPTSPDWYTRAQAAISDFDALRARLARVADPGERARILAWFGDPAQAGTPANRYLAVGADASAAQRAGTAASYANPTVTDRVALLEDSVRQLDAMVTNAETAYGQLTQPVALAPITQASTQKQDWTTPALIGIGLVTAGIVIAKITKKGRR